MKTKIFAISPHDKAIYRLYLLCTLFLGDKFYLTISTSLASAIYLNKFHICCCAKGNSLPLAAWGARVLKS